MIRGVEVFGMNADDFSLFAVCSERYAMGRQTYVVGDVCETIAKYLPKIPDNYLKVLIADIESSGNLGDEHIDKPVWLGLLAQLKEEKAKR